MSNINTYNPIPSAFYIPDKLFRMSHASMLENRIEIIGAIKQGKTVNKEPSKTSLFFKKIGLINNPLEFDEGCRFAKVMSISAICSPIAVCCIPITIVADIVIGIFESFICFYKRLPLSDIITLMKKKIVYYPLQQSAFLIAYSIIPSMFSFVLISVLFKNAFETRRSLPSIKACFYTAAIGLQLGTALTGFLSYMLVQSVMPKYPRFFFLINVTFLLMAEQKMSLAKNILKEKKRRKNFGKIIAKIVLLLINPNILSIHNIGKIN